MPVSMCSFTPDPAFTVDSAILKSDVWFSAPPDFVDHHYKKLAGRTCKGNTSTRRGARPRGVLSRADLERLKEYETVIN
eukprot:3869996-Alexandrium_andersonii.AAC.1